MTGKITFTEKVGKKICQLMAGGKSLNKICKDADMPCRATVNNWLLAATEPDAAPELKVFLDKYAQAREMLCDVLMDDTLDIADDDSLDIGFTDDGKPFVKGENIQRSRLRVDTRITYAKQCAPKKYNVQRNEQRHVDKHGDDVKPTIMHAEILARNGINIDREGKND